MGARYAPRRMDLASLVKVLVAEHEAMRHGLQTAREAASRGDFEGVGKTLRELEPVFKQHIADEEAQILGLLLAALGKEGAKEEIEVFRQHRPIYKLMLSVKELAAMPTAELEERQAELEELFDSHTEAEEDRVFPRAVSLKAGGEPT